MEKKKGWWENRLKFWLECIQKAKGENKIMAILFGWIFVFTAHDPDDEKDKGE